MKRIEILLCTIICFLLLPINSRAQIKAINGKSIGEASMDAFLRQQMEALNIPGLSIAFIDDGQIVYHRAIGLANIEYGTQVGKETIFEAASMSKTVFAYYVMKLVDKKLITLDTPLFKYLPNPDIAYDERYKLITARMVLSHTSGLPNWRGDTPPDSVRNIPFKGALYLKFIPGTKVSYSGEGFQYLVKVVAHVLNTNIQQLGEVVYKELFLPIGMRHSWFGWNDYIKEHKATGYIGDGEANQAGAYNQHREFNAAGGLHSNAPDFARFLIALIDGKGLKNQSLNEMLKVQSKFPRTSSHGEAWGLGLTIKQTAFGNRYLGSGNNVNFQSFFSINKEKKRGYVFFINNNMSDVLFSKLESFFTYGIPPLEKSIIKLSKDSLKRYTGEYGDGQLQVDITSSNEQMYFQELGSSSKSKIYPTSQRDFIFKIDSDELKFIRDATGEVTGVEIHGSSIKRLSKVPPGKGKYVCSPCGLACDKLTFEEPGKCPHCKMALIKGNESSQEKRKGKVAILLFDGVQIIDFTGPYEVLGQAGYQVMTVSGSPSVKTNMGMKVTSDFTFSDCPDATVFVIPGGNITGTKQSKQAIQWIKDYAQKSDVVMSVCNGALILAETGLLDGLTTTTYHNAIAELRKDFPKIKVVSDQRYVDNGKFITTAGLSSGMDGAVHIIEKLKGKAKAQTVALNLEYNWNSDNDYVRASLADKYLNKIFEGDDKGHPAISSVRLISTEGDKHKWKLEYELEATTSAEEIRKFLDGLIAQRVDWKKEMITLPGSSSWHFISPEKESWKGILEVNRASSASNSFKVVFRIEKSKI